MSKNNETTTTLSSEAKKRIFLDTKYILKNPLTDMGIYYKNDEDDLSLGYALMIGPEDTPYQYGYYLFEFKYPHNYPYSPPKVTNLTTNGYTRFNPNLYVNGKVCLSLLNTWQGPSWKPCQTLNSVLVSILSSVFVSNPIENEPSFTKKSIENNAYNEIIRFKNIDFSCLCMYLKKHRIHHKAYDIFYPTIQAHFKENYEKINAHIIKSCETYNSVKNLIINDGFCNGVDNYIKLPLYNMNIEISYEALMDIFCEIDIGV